MQTSRRVRRLHLLRLVAVTALVSTALLAYLGTPANAAGDFASPAFRTQWQAGEMLAPNFWGPLTLARNGEMEPYDGAMRQVQYFDKARMELAANGTVTNGLLAKELITGQLQLGDNTFQQGSPAAIPVAGDPDNLGPYYASIGTSGLTSTVPNAANTPVTRALSTSGVVGTFTSAMGDAQSVITAFDNDTQHNVPRAFADYRGRVGLAAIGFGIAEPFWSRVKVAGTDRDVLIQAFQRRVLTYTPSNEERFRVEFGNIGQHYYTWRYNSPGALNTPTPAGFPGTATANAGATATVGATATANANATLTATAAPATDTAPPKFTSAPRVPYLTPNSFAVTWTTDEPAGSELLFGESESYEQENTALREVYTTEHQVVVRNLTPGKTYNYRIRSRDVAGNSAQDTENRKVTLPAEKNDGSMGAVPKITNINVTRRATTFTVTWNTDLPARPRVEFGRTNLPVQSNGEGLDRFRTSDTSGTSHTVTAIALEPDTAYRFRIVAVSGGDGGPTSSASNDRLVASTLDTAVTMQEGTKVRINDLTATPERGRVVLTFGTDRNAAPIIEIGATNRLGGGLFYGSSDDPQGLRDYPFPLNRTRHTVTLALKPGTYFYRLSVYGDDGTGTSEIKSFTVT